MSVAASSNPITSVAPSSSPITSVPESSPYPPAYNPTPSSNGQLISRLKLDMRGERFTVERETLMNLPESILLSLFPNGLILSRQGGWDGDGEDTEENHVFAVDYDPSCFSYILHFWSSSHTNFYGPPSSPHSGLFHHQQHLSSPHSSPTPTSYPISDYPTNNAGENPLIVKQPIIVLREELEYFSIIPSTNEMTNPKAKTQPPHPGLKSIKVGPNGQPTEELLRLKRQAGKALLERQQIFTALQRNVSKEGNLAEQHLIDMLCMSGFSRDDTWGHRSLEPTRTVISSIALVLLKTGIHHPTPAELAADPTARVTIDQNQMNTAQKLLLFWRKPARKCWWDGIEVDIPLNDSNSKETAKVKVWARRVWTLELSLI